jgi:hypothetical protein
MTPNKVAVRFPYRVSFYFYEAMKNIYVERIGAIDINRAVIDYEI